MILFPKIVTSLFLLIVVVPAVLCTIIYEETDVGIVGAGNYTYYQVFEKGTILISLKSIKGDADLYISSKSIKPTFELDHHNLQSVTCGYDHVQVPSTFARPIIIGVYGHPFHDYSSFELRIAVDNTQETDFVEAKEHSYEYYASSPSSRPFVASPKSNESEDEESFLWTLFISILKVLLELIAS